MAEDRKQKLSSIYHAASPYGWLILLIAVAWFYVAALIYSKNWYGVYQPRVLIKGLVVIPILYMGLALVFGKLILPRLKDKSWKRISILLIFALVIAGLLAWLFPPPVPVINKLHTLRLIPTGEKNPESKATIVEVEQLRALDGTPISLDGFRLAGDWELSRNRLVYSGRQPASVAEFTGEFPVGVDLRLRFQPKAGKLLVQLDNVQQEYDLYSAWELGGNVALKLPAQAGYTPVDMILSTLGNVLYFLGIASSIFVLILVVELRVLPIWVERLILVLIYLGIFVFYLGLKRSYANFNAERIYGDTITYVQTAQSPLVSRAFWFSDRTFTLPILYKITGMRPDNFTDKDVMRTTADFQTWISAICWAVLGIAMTGSLRKKWLGPAVFAVILLFSLGLEISLWDRLMYSESVSFSLFALVLASWIGLGEQARKQQSQILGYLYLLAMLLVTIFYSFTRDTNLYLILSGALVFTLAVILKRIPSHSRKYYLIYSVVALGLFIYQNMTVNLGDRWQIHIYDNLVRRFLFDPEALNYFEEAGLPVSQELQDLSTMGVAEYQGLLMRSELPEYKSVRDWVNQSGQSTYIRYLIEHPDKSLLTPIRQFETLINGSNIEYRYPIFPEQTVPEVIELNDQKVYFRSPLSLGVLLFIIGFGIVAYWFGKDRDHPAWLALTVLMVSIPPMVFIIWNGNPLEIERHAIQIGIQFRLAGWVALFLLMDWLAVTLLAKQDENATRE